MQKVGKLMLFSVSFVKNIRQTRKFGLFFFFQSMEKSLHVQFTEISALTVRVRFFKSVSRIVGLLGRSLNSAEHVSLRTAWRACETAPHSASLPSLISSRCATVELRITRCLA